MRRRPLIALTAALVALAIGTTGARAEGVVPVEGPWQATTSAGLPVTFEVAAGEVRYPTFHFKWGFCGTYASPVGPTVPIDTAGHWGFVETSGPSIEATFVAPDRAEGTVIAPSRELPGCPETRATFVAEPGGAPFVPGPALVHIKVGAPKVRASRPDAIVLKKNGSFRLDHLHWRSWGEPTVYGSGRAAIRRPCGRCRGGERIWRPRVKLRLNGLTQEKGFRLYYVLRYELSGPVSSRFHRDNTVYL
jgi:hypothetical protein